MKAEESIISSFRIQVTMTQAEVASIRAEDSAGDYMLDSPTAALIEAILESVETATDED